MLLYSISLVVFEMFKSVLWQSDSALRLYYDFQSSCWCTIADGFCRWEQWTRHEVLT